MSNLPKGSSVLCHLYVRIEDVEKLQRHTSWLDSFKIQGPNGTYACYVTCPASMSLSDAKDGSYVSLFKLEAARVIAAQLVIAVDYIDTQGFAHGDLYCGNVRTEIPFGFTRLSDEELYNIYGEPGSEAVTHLDGKELSACIPSRAVVPVWFGDASEELAPSDAKILLSDFGEAFFPAKHDKFETCTPLVNRAPEARFESTTPLSFPSDIWSLACLIWDTITQRPVLERLLASEDQVTRDHKAWQNKLSEDEKPINRELYRSLANRNRFKDSPAERDAVLSLLWSMLSFRSENLPSAKEVLASELMVQKP
ncbi:kinase-like domain-containing protein [Aspergillus caelatus]|uniref:Kinase-like domain-containing protein n=1 Tax=Aspergillus caelatus TaxID=61420 RepID=A0A5N6ZV29_9EURO|nr:kinase-like domain-containing protein [Aspergillus caelatus]KAE8361238.1 kinase-like domain-containing protein [Aspergillus caelatus]